MTNDDGRKPEGAPERSPKGEGEQARCFSGNPSDIAAVFASDSLVGKRKQCLAGSDWITGEERSGRIENISKHGCGVS